MQPRDSEWEGHNKHVHVFPHMYTLSHTHIPQDDDAAYTAITLATIFPHVISWNPHHLIFLLMPVIYESMKTSAHTNLSPYTSPVTDKTRTNFARVDVECILLLKLSLARGMLGGRSGFGTFLVLSGRIEVTYDLTMARARG